MFKTYNTETLKVWQEQSSVDLPGVQLSRKTEKKSFDGTRHTATFI